MPDLRSELEKVIHAWEQPNDQPQITHNIMNTKAPSFNEIIFDFVRANPGLTSKEIETRITTIPANSISSLLAQMARRHLLIKTEGPNGTGVNGTFSTNAAKYMSPAEQLGVGRNQRMSKGKGKHKAKAKAKATPKAKQQDLFTSPPPAAPVAPAAPQLPPIMPVAPQMRAAFDFDVESLTIAEARALRDKLNALFGA